jgi:glycine/D-amino acid oxidase-like deaminating enzyme
MPDNFQSLPLSEPSFWVKRHLERADIVIVGGGLVGLLTSIRLKQKFPKREVWVLDKAPFLWSASWRNAGFACYGSAGELLDEARRSSRNQALELYRRRFDGLVQLREEFGDASLGFESSGGWELFQSEAEAQAVFRDLEELNQDLKSISGSLPFQIRSSQSLGMRIAPEAIFAAQEGAIQSHLLLRSVRNKALSLGVECYEGQSVNKLQATDSQSWVLELESGLTLKTRDLVLCTNAYTGLLQEDVELQPARGQVMVTSAMPDLPFRGIFHADQGYLYARTLGTRVLLGGGRNLDFTTEETLRSEGNEVIREHLLNYLKEVLVPGQEFSIQEQWSGIMAMGESREPIVQQRAPGLYLAVRMGGMGVALSSEVATRVSRLFS